MGSKSEPELDKTDVHELKKRQISRYDLPIEFLKKYGRFDWSTQYPTFRVSLPPLRHLSTGSEDYAPEFDFNLRQSMFIAKNPFVRRSKFSSIKQSVLLKIIDAKPHFEFLRSISLGTLHCDIRDKLQIIYDTLICYDDTEKTTQSLPNQVFSWSREDFYMRRQLKQFIWVDIIQASISQSCAEVLKTQVDLEEIAKYITLIFRGLIQAPEDPIDVQKEVLDCIVDAKDFLNIEDQLQEEFKVESSNLRRDVNKSLEMAFKRRNEAHRQLRQNIIDEGVNTEVFEPIATRYQVNYYKSQVDQAEDKFNILEENYRTKLNKIENLQKLEALRCESILSTYDMEIDNFKYRIAEYTNLFEQDFTEADDKNLRLRLNLEKLQEQRRFLTEQIQRFHEEIEDMRLRDERAAENLRKLLAERALAKPEKKKKKARKS